MESHIKAVSICRVDDSIEVVWVYFKEGRIGEWSRVRIVDSQIVIF